MPHYIIPARTKNLQGAERKVGFELEFSGLDVAETCRLITAVYLGKTSVAFDFEAEFIRGLAKSLDVPCKVFKIFNPRVELGEDTHVSEQSFDTIKFDDVILNTGTIQDLRNTAIEIIGDIDARV